MPKTDQNLDIRRTAAWEALKDLESAKKKVDKLLRGRVELQRIAESSWGCLGYLQTAVDRMEDVAMFLRYLSEEKRG